MSADRAGVHPVDDPDHGPGPGGITGRDGTHITDTELDAWIDAFAAPDAATRVPPGTGLSTSTADTTRPCRPLPRRRRPAGPPAATSSVTRAGEVRCPLRARCATGFL